MKTLVCIETGRKTAIDIDGRNEWEIDDLLDVAALRLLRREPEHKHDWVSIRADNLRSEICHSCGDLIEHTGEYRSFRIEKN